MGIQDSAVGPASGATRAARSLPRLLWSAVLVVDVFVCGLVATVGYQSHAQVTEQAQITLANLSRVLEENLSGFLGKIDLALHAVEGEINRQSLDGMINPSQLNAFIAIQDAHLSEALGIRLVDANGVITNAPDSKEPATKVSIGDLDHFLRLKTDPAAGLVISQPLLGRLTGKWLIAVGRRLNNPDGSFRGEVQVSVPVEHFQTVFSGLKLGPGGTVTLYDQRPSIVARYAETGGAGNVVGSTTISEQLRAFIESGRLMESVRVHSPVDDVTRRVVYRKIGDYPLYLVVGLSDQDIYAGWRRTVYGMSGLAGLFIVLSVVFARMVHRSWTELSEKNTALARSNADLEQFAYVASHDLQTPLRNIVSYTQLLERRYKGQFDADADDFIGFIVANSKQMSRLISDLLEYSRSTSQSKTLQPVAAGEAVALALNNLQTAIEQSGVELSLGMLPTVMADQTLLASLFQNLLGNALKYRSLDRTLTLSVSAEQIDREYWRFAVADNGIGIEAQYHDKIFEIFQRLSPA